MWPPLLRCYHPVSPLCPLLRPRSLLSLAPRVASPDHTNSLVCVPEPQMVFRANAPTDSIGTAPSPVVRSLLASLAALHVWCSFPASCPLAVCALVHLLPSHAIAIINKLSTFSARRLRGCLARPPPSSPQYRYILSPPTCHAFSSPVSYTHLTLPTIYSV